nr:holo-ACP synthase [Clostridia bacterium]
MCKQVGQGPANESVSIKTPNAAIAAIKTGTAVRGIGIDLCGIARMQLLLDEGRSLRRMFTEDEQAYIAAKGAAAAPTTAGLYAAKEAVLKALGTGLTIPMTDIVIHHTALGQPVVTLLGKAAEMGGKVHLSITHEGDAAAAFAVWTD